MFKGLSLNELHCVKVTAPGSAQMEDRGNIRMAHAGGGTCFAQKAKPSRFVTEISFANDLQRYRTTQINVERLVGDAPRPSSIGLPSSPNITS
jgi:hypothetical protein